MDGLGKWNITVRGVDGYVQKTFCSSQFWRDNKEKQGNAEDHFQVGGDILREGGQETKPGDWLEDGHLEELLFGTYTQERPSQKL